MRINWKTCLAAWALLASQAALLRGQTPVQPPRVFTLQQAIEYAVQHHPSLRAAAERVQATRGGVDLARANYMPSVNTLWQSNRATANNTFGLLFPQSVIPSISGPVLPNTSGRAVWGSAAGVLASWEPFDFGYRRALVNAARAGEGAARAQSDLTQLEVATAAAQSFLSLLASEQVVKAAQANVGRWEFFAKSVHVLVDNQLRPGADASRADAELARARTQLIQAQTSVRINRAAFKETLGLTGSEVDVDPGELLAVVPEEDVPALQPGSHPAAEAESALLDQVKSQKHAQDRSFVPHFMTQAAVAGRGSGANTDGTQASGLNGLGLERANYAAGVTITFPLFDYFSIRARKKIAAANERSEAARYDQTLLALSDQAEQARARLDGAREIARNTPIELQASRDGEVQSKARYQSGLTTVVEVSEAESLLANAEIDDALARLNVWRALVEVAAAQGTLQPVMDVLQRKTP